MTWQILHGDALQVLKGLPRESVQCIVTSPPYWGLRDYGTGTWEGGDAGCDHQGPPVRTQAGFNARYFGKQFENDKQGEEREPFKATCGKCGARRADHQLGLEATPAEYVARMVEVFREAREVLREDGILWANWGDCFATGAGRVGACPGGGAQGEGWTGPTTQPNRMPLPGLKPKDLVGIPWRMAFALQDDGWWLRSDCIWAKPNPMPESVTDRPTKSHEYVFLLTKAAKYFYDADAVREEAEYGRRDWGGADQHAAYLRSRENLIKRGDRQTPEAYTTGADPSAGRNLRTVWSFPTEPFPGSHFATFPKLLAQRCILAGSRPGDLVLDPFCGSGTTGLVALRHSRRFLGIELRLEYVQLATRRIRDDAPLFNSF